MTIGKSSVLEELDLERFIYLNKEKGSGTSPYDKK